MTLKSLILLALFPSMVLASPFATDISKAFASAKKKNRPLLISFYGIWCPPCNELEETVFESPAFLEKAKRFELLKVDADATTSWKLKDQYRVGGYPTVVFTSAKGKEIYRVVGYRSPSEFLNVMDLVLSAKGKDLELACKSKDLDDTWRCAEVCSLRRDVVCAKAAFTKLENRLAPGSPRYEEAREFFVENAETPDLKRDGYERLLGEFTLTPRAAVWAMRYTAFLPGLRSGVIRKKEPLLERVVSVIPQMLADPRLEEFGVTPSDLLQAKALILSALGKKVEAKAAWKERLAELDAEAKTLPSGASNRGYTLERIEALDESGDREGALKLAREFQSRYPNEFTFNYLVAHLLEGNKKYNDALPAARKAYEASYGDNRVRAATLLVQLYATLPDRAAAQKVHDDVVREVKPDPSLKVRTADYLKKLEEAWTAFPTKG